MNGRPVALLMLADGRFPCGGHAHSAGMEIAVARGEVLTTADLAGFLGARLRTTGVVDASFAAATVVRAADPDPPWDELDAELSARMASPAQRAASRALGRQLTRAVARVWTHAALDALMRTAAGPHHAVAVGASAYAAELTPADAAFVAAYGTVTTPANAALRLLGLDPVEIQRMVAELGPAIQCIVDDAVGVSTGSLAALPAMAAPASELAAEAHRRRTARLFTS